jgi:hypothetical protein
VVPAAGGATGFEAGSQPNLEVELRHGHASGQSLIGLLWHALR